MTPTPQIEICRDGPMFRVVVTPADILPPSWTAPSTFSSMPLARMSAKLLADASGLPIVDMAAGRAA